MKFRKQPVVIDAVQATEVTRIQTLEGLMTADVGDWIVTGVKGERYPCKPDIFKATYVCDECRCEPGRTEGPYCQSCGRINGSTS